MSNEYKDWSNDVMTTLNIKMAEADLLPSGWVNTFVHNLKQELASALGPYVYDFEVLQIKDKNATMRVYWSWADRDYTIDEENDLNILTDEIESIIIKYEHISYKTCVACGKPADEYSGGWVLPFCYHCYKRGAF
jgi:hypothetical protein